MNQQRQYEEEEEQQQQQFLLQDLKRENAERWKKLKLLHSSSIGNGNGGRTSSGENNDAAAAADAAAPPSPSFSSRRDDTNHNGDSSPASRRRTPTTLFLREVVETHEELIQTRAILEQRLRRDRTKLQRIQEIMTEERAAAAARSSKTLQQQEGAVMTSTSRSAESLHRDHQEALQQEQKWLLEELAYVAGLIDSSNNISTTTKSTGRNNSLWTLERLTRELIETKEPYLLASALPIHPKHLEILDKCLVIEHNEINPDLIRLTDYLGKRR